MCGSQRSRKQPWLLEGAEMACPVIQFSVSSQDTTIQHSMHRTVERMELDNFQTHDNFSPQSGQSKFLNFSGLDLGYGNGTGTVFAFNGKCLWFVPVQGYGVGSFITI